MTPVRRGALKDEYPNLDCLDPMHGDAAQSVPSRIPTSSREAHEAGNHHRGLGGVR